MSETAFTFPPPPPPPPRFGFNTTQANRGSQDITKAQRSWDQSRGGGRGYRRGGGRGSASVGHRAYYNSSNQPSLGSHHRIGDGDHHHKQGFHHSWRGTSLQRPGAAHNDQYRGNYVARGRGSAQSRNVGVAPSIPSFGGPLPHLTDAASSNVPSGNSTNDKKRKREHNQLGLTPAKETYEDSDEVEDEEAKHAAAHGASAVGLEFTYRGEISALNSPAEIGAWIAERKKRYPTQARREREEKRQQELKTLRQAALKAQKEVKEKQQAEAKIEAEKAATARRKATSKQAARVDTARNANKENEVIRARKKIEKLERRIEEEKRKMQSACVGSEAMSIPLAPNVGPGALVRTKSPPCQISEMDGSATSSELSDQSSGSESDSDDSPSSSDSSSSTEPPEARPVPPRTPQKIPPPKRHARAMPLCHNVSRFGRCKRVDCRFRHEDPGPTSVGNVRQDEMTLYQRLVQQEKEEEDQTVLAAIIHLGRHGRLGPVDGSRPDVPSSTRPSFTP